MNFGIGDKIKVIPDDYISVAKLGLNQPNAWENVSSAEGKHIMLGGTYEVLAVKRSVAAFAGNKEINFYKIIQGNTNFDKISEFDVLPLDQVERCQLQVGDAVLFRPKCSFQDMEYLKAVDSFGLSDPDKEHKVTCILNDYYVFIDVPKDDPYSFPFRWVDFKRGER